MVFLIFCRKNQFFSFQWSKRGKKGGKVVSKKGENIRLRSDGRWEARYVKSRDSSGKAILGYLYGKSYAEVKRKKEELLYSETLNNHSLITFGHVIDLFLSQEQYRVKESTYAHYKNLLITQVYPSLGSISVSLINAEIIEKLTLDKLTNGRIDGTGGLSSKTVKDILGVIRLVLKYAIEKDFIDEHVLSFSDPRLTKTPIEIIPHQELERIKNASLTCNSEMIGVYFCLYTGLRLGELCALLWDDIDLTKGTVNINKTMLRINDFSSTAKSKTKIVIDKPKTESSNRIIPLPQCLVSMLSSIKQKGADHSYFLTGTSHYIEPRTYYAKYKRFLSGLGLKDYSFHALRHTFATYCIELGFDPKTLSEILGHSDVKITLDRYVHPSMDMKRSCMNMLD